MRTIRPATALAVLGTVLVLQAPAPAFAAPSTGTTASLSIAQGFGLVAAGTVLLVAVVFAVRANAVKHAAELRGAMTRQRAIIDAIPDALFRMDGDGRFLEFKPSTDFEPVFPPDAFLGKTVRELSLPTGMIIHWEAAMEIVRREGGHRSFEYQLDYPDGPHDFEARIVQAAPGEYLAIVRDISATKQAEADSAEYRHQLELTVTRRTSDLIEANIRLQEANRAKSAFLANMSHELRTPLNSVIGFTDILLQGLAGDLNDEQQRQMTMVQHAGRELLALVDDVLDYTRIESGRVAAFPADFRLKELLASCVAQVRTDAEIKGLGLELDIDGAPATIHSDRRLLEQVVLHLLANAVKFTVEGAVTLRACPADDDSLIIEVRDTGIGIDPDLKKIIFHAFEQGMGTHRVKAHGLGLGLAICHQLTHLLEGSIELDSSPGTGTMARVTIPTRLEVPRANAKSSGE
jgi:signal transduction histidine kinase